jgi:hypothetical protein
MGINYLGNLWENMDIKYPYLRKEVSKWIKSIHLYKIAAECLLFPASGWQGQSLLRKPLWVFVHQENLP